MPAAHNPTDATTKQVEAMASYGIPQDDIARVLGIDPKTLRKHYPDVLDTASTKATSLVAQSLFRKATAADGGSSSVTAAIFWLKTRAGWKETAVVENVGKDGGPINAALAVTAMSAEKFEAIAKKVADEF